MSEEYKRDKVDHIYNVFWDGPCQTAVDIMTNMSMTEHAAVLLAPLTISCTWKDELPGRAAYAAKVRAELTERQLDHVDDLMRGLE